MYPGLVKSTGIVFDSGLLVGPEPHATILYDKSRYRSNGAFKSSGHPAWVQLPSGLWVMDFDSSALDYVEIPAAYDQLDFTSEDFSIIMRIYLDLAVGTQILFMRGLSNADGYMLICSNPGIIEVRTSQSGALQSSYSASNQLVAATHYTVGMSRDGASIKVFKNGVDVTDTKATHINPATCARTAKIGVYDDLGAAPVDGKIEFLRIYNYALSATQHRKMHDSLKHWV